MDSAASKKRDKAYAAPGLGQAAAEYALNWEHYALVVSNDQQ